MYINVNKCQYYNIYIYIYIVFNKVKNIFFERYRRMSLSVHCLNGTFKTFLTISHSNIYNKIVIMIMTN